MRSPWHASLTLHPMPMHPAEPLAGRPRHDACAFEETRQAKCMSRRERHERERERERERARGETEREHENAACLEHAHANTCSSSAT